MKILARAIVLACAGCNVGFLRAASEYPNVAAGDTVTVSSDRTETSVKVAGTLIVTGGKVAQAAATTVTLGSPAGSATPALIKVTGGKFGNAHGSTNPMTVNIGEDGGSGSFLVTGGELGVAKLNISEKATGNGFIDIARLEGGIARFRQSVNNNANVARMTIAGPSVTFGTEHGWYPTMFSGKGAFEITSENGAPMFFSQKNVYCTMNATNTVVRLTGKTDCAVDTQDSTVKYNNGFCFANEGAVTLMSTGKTWIEHIFQASGILGSGVTNLYLTGMSRLSLNATTEACVRDVTAETVQNQILGAGTLVADATARDITVDASLGGSVVLRKIGAKGLSLGSLAVCVPSLEIAAGDVTVTGDTVVTNLSVAAGSGVTVDGGSLTVALGDVNFHGNAPVLKNGGTISLWTTAEKPPVLRSGLVLSVNEYFIDGIAQKTGEYAVGDGVVRVVASNYPRVDYGQTVMISESHSDMSPYIRGHLIVLGGTSAAEPGTAVSLGSPKGLANSAVIEVRDGLYGMANNNTPAALTIGADGGRGCLVAKGGELRFATVAISENAAVDESGYIDYGRVEGGVLRLRSTANDSASTGRIVFVSNTGTLAGEHGWGATTYTKGSFVIESLPGARIAYQYANQHATFNKSGVNVWLRGTGDMLFTQDAASSGIAFNKGCLLDAAGTLRFLGPGSATFNASGLVGPNVTGLELSDGAYLTLGAGTENTVRRLTADSKGYVADSAATIVLDSAAGEAEFDVAVKGARLTLVKNGQNVLTLGTLTTNVPCFKAPDGGEIRVRGALTLGSATLGGVSSLVIDGGRLVVGPDFRMAAGTVRKTNRGSIVVHATSSSAPVFPAGAMLDVDEYWLDGVRQANGTHTVGGATLSVSTYDESALSVWTNNDASQSEYTFVQGSRFLGMRLRTPPASLAFSGGEIALGSAGIAVEDTAGMAPFYSFNLPVGIATAQKWAFGSASATFNGPIALAADALGCPSLEISSDADLTFAGTNSSFCGDVVVTGRNIRVTGVNALGTGAHGGTLTLKVFRTSQTSNECSIDNAVIDQPVNFSIPAKENNIYALRFKAGTTNVLRGAAVMPVWTRFCAGSTTIFEKGCTFTEYTRQLLDGNATVIIREQLMLIGSGAARCTHPCSEGEYLSNRICLDCSVSYNNTPENFAVYLVGELHCLRDYCFTSGWITSEDKPAHRNAVFHLNGHPQRLGRFTANGVVSSTNAPAALELAIASGKSYTNSAVVDGLAGVRMVGYGTAVFTSSATTRGKVEAESGVLQLDGTWRNASEVSVSDTGVLKVTSPEKPFGPNVTMRLSGAGGIELPSGAVQRVGELYLNGSEAPARPGTYTAANTGGLVRSGSVVVGMKSTALIIR